MAGPGDRRVDLFTVGADDLLYVSAQARFQVDGGSATGWNRCQIDCVKEKKAAEHWIVPNMEKFLKLK